MAIPTAKEFFFSTPALDAEMWAARERAFFRSIRLKNGTYKTTYSHRLDSLNEIVNAALPPQRPLEIMDVAASSGIATLEWMDSLREAGIDYRMTAGDLCVRAFLLSFGRSLNVLVDKTGYPLQFDIFGRAIPYPPRRRLAVLFPPLFVVVHTFRWFLPTLFSFAFKRSAVENGDASPRRLGIECRPAALVSPRLSQRTSLTILDDDILAAGAFENRFHVIRAANVLNRTYFSEETLGLMVANLSARLRPSGTLIVSRTHDDGSNHGTVFRLNEAVSFDVVSRIGNGSEIESLVQGQTARGWGQR